MYISPKLGSDLSTEIRKCVGIATMLDETVWMTFNGVKIAIAPGTSFENTYAEFTVKRSQEQGDPRPPKLSLLDEKLKDPEYAKAYAQADMQMQFWEGLLEQMKAQDISVDMMAERIGVTPASLRLYMAGELDLTLDRTALLCHAANCDIRIEIARRS